MINLNNAYLTKQSKADFLRLEVDKDYREEKKRMLEEGYRCPSPSYWVLTFREFVELASASQKLNTLFSGRFEHPDSWFPESNFILMEHDSIEAGEWDNFTGGFAPIGFQNVCVIAVDGVVRNEIPKLWNGEEEDLKVAHFNWEKMEGWFGDYGNINNYCGNKTLNEINKIISAIDLWDIPIKELDEYEEKRVYKRTYLFSNAYEELFKKDINALNTSFLKLIRKKLAKKAFRKAGFTPSSNKGRGKKK